MADQNSTAYSSYASGKRSRVYNTWAGMIQRCRNPRSKAYPMYGGRGIRVCERWLKFSGFLEDMGEPPEKHSLDRIDNDGDYEPANCRWADRVTQNNNQRERKPNRGWVLLTAFGETKSISAWARDPRCQVQLRTLNARVTRNGWDHERAISERAWIGGCPADSGDDSSKQHSGKRHGFRL